MTYGYVAAAMLCFEWALERRDHEVTPAEEGATIGTIASNACFKLVIRNIAADTQDPCGVLHADLCSPYFTRYRSALYIWSAGSNVGIMTASVEKRTTLYVSPGLVVFVFKPTEDPGEMT